MRQAVAHLAVWQVKQTPALVTDLIQDSLGEQKQTT